MVLSPAQSPGSSQCPGWICRGRVSADGCFIGHTLSVQDDFLSLVLALIKYPKQKQQTLLTLREL